ncbi:MAG: glycosyl transferase, partial [Rhodobacteraceae bacterium]|nr:glycosyl transferase [Paracoccaceae bacterium]
LTGVTGGGLPAEIWHETMVRVNDGLPANPLPMIRPKPKPKAQPVPQRRQDRGNPIDNILRGLLGLDR